MAMVYRWWAAIVALAVLVQIGLAGYGAFHAAEKIEDADSLSKSSWEDGWDPHAGFGYLVVLGGILLFLISLGTREGRTRPRLWWNLALPLLLILQVILAWIGESVGGLGFLHPINAFVIMGLAGSLAGRAWRGGVRPARATTVT